MCVGSRRRSVIKYNNQFCGFYSRLLCKGLVEITEFNQFVYTFPLFVKNTLNRLRGRPTSKTGVQNLVLKRAVFMLLQRQTLSCGCYCMARGLILLSQLVNFHLIRVRQLYWVTQKHSELFIIRHHLAVTWKIVQWHEQLARRRKTTELEGQMPTTNNANSTWGRAIFANTTRNL